MSRIKALEILKQKNDKARRLPGNRKGVTNAKNLDKFARFIKLTNKRKLGRK